MATEDTAHELLRRADTYRLDLAAARQQVALQADALGVTRSFRWLGDLQVGVETERETDRSRITGPTLAVELPIFNQGEGRIARAQAQLEQAEAELRVLEIDIGNAVQGGVAEVAAARARVAHYRDSLIPLRKEIVARAVGAALPSSTGRSAVTVDAHSLVPPDAATGHAHGAQQDPTPTHGAPVQAQPAQSVHHHHIRELP